MSSWRTSHFPQHPQQQQGGGGGGFYGNYPNHGQQSSSNAGGGNNNGGAGVPIENGPRAKCDQVVFEAIAKAAEIVVGSRCWIDPTTIAVQQQQLMNYTNQAGTHNNYVGAGNGQYNGGSSSRFNLLVPEVQGVRYVQQRKRHASCVDESFVCSRTFIFHCFLTLSFGSIVQLTISTWAPITCIGRFFNGGSELYMYPFDWTCTTNMRMASENCWNDGVWNTHQKLEKGT